MEALLLPPLNSHAAPATGSSYGLSLRPEQPSREWLSKYELQDVMAQFYPGSREAACSRHMLAHSATVAVLCDTTASGKKRGRYGNVMHCGNPHSCPVCAPRIASTRQRELTEALTKSKAMNCHAVFVTLTVPHTRQDALGDLLLGLQGAFTRLTNRRPVKRLYREVWQCWGYQRTLEVIDTDSGWHPHYHLVLFYRGEEITTEALRPFWTKACQSVGFPAPSDDCIDVRPVTSTQLAGYLAKYQGKIELAVDESGARLKDGQVITSFHLLALAGAGNKQATARFHEYHQAMHGRRKVIWSREIRSLLGLGEDLTDVDAVTLEFAEEPDPNQIISTQVQGHIELAKWKLVCRAGARGALLEVAIDQGWAAVEAFLAALEVSVCRPLPAAA
jgi:hypothetical protein